jgi:hypothetical protein
MSTTPLHDWLSPRLGALLREAEAAGFLREATLAVITDLVTGAPFNIAPLPAEPEAIREVRFEPTEAGSLRPASGA